MSSGATDPEVISPNSKHSFPLLSPTHCALCSRALTIHSTLDSPWFRLGSVRSIAARNSYFWLHLDRGRPRPASLGWQGSPGVDVSLGSAAIDQGIASVVKGKPPENENRKDASPKFTDPECNATSNSAVQQAPRLALICKDSGSRPRRQCTQQCRTGLGVWAVLQEASALRTVLLPVSLTSWCNVASPSGLGGLYGPDEGR
jgi:hypothetical protein